MRILATLGLVALAATGAHASTLVLSEFDFFTPSYVSGSWDIPTMDSAPNRLTIGNFGTVQPVDDGAFGVFNAPADWTAFTTITLTGAAFGGEAWNDTTVLNFFAMDEFANTAITQFNLADFSTGPGFSSITIGLDLIGIDATRVTDWGFGTNAVGTTNFAFTFDQVAINSVAVPEPSTYATLLSVGSLVAVVAHRRLRARRKV